MYTIKMINGSTETLIYNDITPELTSTKLLNPTLDLKDNSAGSLTFTMPDGNSGYSTIKPIISTVEVYREGSWLWTGRVLTVEKDFWLQKKVTCEGALAFFNDTIASLTKYSNCTFLSYINNLLTIHNNKVATNRKIFRGSISGTTSSGAAIDNKDYILEDDNVLSYLLKAADDWGLHFRIRKSSGSLYLDMLTDAQLNMSTQRIDFGKNLLDYSDKHDWSNIITVLHPLGASLDTNNITGDEEYPDRVVINSNPSTSGYSRSGEYLINNSAVSTYGRIEETVTWSEVEDPNVLLSLAELYLSDYQYNELELTVKVLDLHYLLNSGEVAFNFLDQVNCYSKPHGLDTTFIISEMNIPFDKPEQTTFQFKRTTQGSYGSDKKSSGIASGKISDASSEIMPKDTILSYAKENATSMIDMATNGFVTMVPTQQGDRTSAIVISNNVDPDAATRKWTWNVNGLMHQSRATSSSSWNAANLALTMDGAIVADRITTGVLSVADSYGGVLFSANMNTRVVTIAGFKVKDEALYTNNKNTLTNHNYGVYLGTDGIAVGGSQMYSIYADGYIRGGVQADTAYVAFNSYNIDTGVYGIRVCGNGCVAIGTNGFFGVGNYVGIDQELTVAEGVTQSITFGNDTSFTLNFEHGLMNTVLV